MKKCLTGRPGDRQGGEPDRQAEEEAAGAGGGRGRQQALHLRGRQRQEGGGDEAAQERLPDHLRRQSGKLVKD